jgi:hypothetical protein
LINFIIQIFIILVRRIRGILEHWGSSMPIVELLTFTSFALRFFYGEIERSIAKDKMLILLMGCEGIEPSTY